MIKQLVNVLFCVSAICSTHLPLSAQVLSDSAQLSLLTIAPTNELYNEFGHTALRIYDPVNNIDYSYNYGVYDFEAPNFLLKFVRGKLPYMMSVVKTANEFAPYRRQQRGVEEQVFNLTPKEIKAVAAFLGENYQPENRYYMYDFIYDNCATRIRDVLEEVLDTRFADPAPMEQNYVTFRALLDEKIPNRPWLRFGFDFILGSPVDHRAGFREEMFLPDYLSSNLGQLQYRGRALMEPPAVIIPAGIIESKPGPITPLSVFIALFVLSLGLTIWNKPKAKRVFDISFYSLLTFCGFFLVFMRYGTDHFVTWNNFNLLWANPLYLFCLLNLFFPRKWMQSIKWLLIAMAINCLLLFNLNLQDFSIVILPILGIIFIRLADGLALFKKKRKDPKKPVASTD